MTGAFGTILEEEGVPGLYKGAIPRAVFAGTLLALEFLMFVGDQSRVLMCTPDLRFLSQLADMITCEWCSK